MAERSDSDYVLLADCLSAVADFLEGWTLGTTLSESRIHYFPFFGFHTQTDRPECAEGESALDVAHRLACRINHPKATLDALAILEELRSYLREAEFINTNGHPQLSLDLSDRDRAWLLEGDQELVQRIMEKANARCTADLRRLVGRIRAEVWMNQTTLASADWQRLVTATEVARMVHLDVGSLGPYRKQWPEPEVKHSGKRPARWRLATLLPILQEQFGRVDLESIRTPGK